MPVCEKCGVEYDNKETGCPLCGSHSVVQKEDTNNTSNGTRTRRIVWEITSMLLLSGILVVVFIDFVVSGSITWSLYVVIPGAGLIAMLSAVTFLHKKGILLITAFFAATSGMLAGIDLVDASLDWFLLLGLPVSFVFFFVTGVLGVVTNRVNRRGLQLIAFYLLGIGVFCIGLELVIQGFNGTPLSPSWSLLVLVSTFPAASVLLFSHYRLKRYVDLRRFFHI